MPVLWVLRLSHHGEVTSRAAGRRLLAAPRLAASEGCVASSCAGPLPAWGRARSAAQHTPLTVASAPSTAAIRRPTICGRRRVTMRSAQIEAGPGRALSRPCGPRPTDAQARPSSTDAPGVCTDGHRPPHQTRAPGAHHCPAGDARLVWPAGRAGRHCPANPTPGALPNGQGRGRLGSSRLPRRAARQAGLPELAGEALLQRVVVHTGALQTSADAAKRVLHGAGSLVPLLEQILERT